MRFKDKVVLITGSSRGAGKAIALAFAEEGADVVINYVKSKDLAEKVVDEIKKIGGNNALAVQADVSDSKQVENMIQTVLKKFGKIDILVNNAGNFKNSLVRKMGKDVWDDVIAVNLNGVFNCTKSVLEHMRERKSGKIINITSVQGQTGVIGASNYAAAKAGIIGFTKSTAKEVARSGVTVNAISFGFLETGMLLRLTPEMQADILSRIPVGRFGDPANAAKPILFLASEDSDYITGQVINVNGGYYM